MTLTQALATAETPEVRAWSAGLETMDLDDVLRWCWEEFGPRAAVGTSFQGAGLVILHRAKRLGLGFPAFTLDTGLLFPETERFMVEAERRLGVNVERIRPEHTIVEQAAEHGPELWSRSPDLCCALRKVLPLQGKLAELDVWITGVRRQQANTRARTGVLERYLFDPVRGRFLFKLNPLAGWTRERVWTYLREHDLPVNPLKLQGYTSIGCQPCTRRLAPGEADDRAGRWTGFDKTECGIHTFLGENI